MLKKLTSTFFVVLFLSGISTALSAQDKMPDWELKNSEGTTVSSSEFAGKPLVIHFWATWCPYCKKLQPGLETLKQKYSSQGVEFIAISFREDEGTQPQLVLNERGITIPTLVEGDQVARELFNVSGTPTTVFVDHKGIIVGVSRTSNPQDPLLGKAVEFLLEGYQSENK